MDRESLGIDAVPQFGEGDGLAGHGFVPALAKAFFGAFEGDAFFFGVEGFVCGVVKIGIENLPEALLVGVAELCDRLQEKVEGNGEVEGLTHKTYSVSIGILVGQGFRLKLAAV